MTSPMQAWLQWSYRRLGKACTGAEEATRTYLEQAMMQAEAQLVEDVVAEGLPLRDGTAQCSKPATASDVSHLNLSLLWEMLPRISAD